MNSKSKNTKEKTPDSIKKRLEDILKANKERKSAFEKISKSVSEKKPIPATNK